MALLKRDWPFWAVFTLLLAVALSGQPPAPPGQAQAASGTITILVDGKPVATGGVINLRSGSGVIASAVANPSLSGTDILFDYNTAFIQSRNQGIENPDHTCISGNGTVAYTCTTGSAWQSYTRGAWVFLIPDTQSNSQTSLSISGLGPVAIKLSDGTTSCGALLQPGRIYLLVYDGVVWRMSQGDSHQ